MTSEGRVPASMSEFMELVRGTKYESIFRSEAEADRMFASMLAESSDPLHREIGRGLADGSLHKSDIAGSAAYQEFVQTGFESLLGLDVQGMVSELAEEKGNGSQASEVTAEPDVDDDVWHGFSERR